MGWPSTGASRSRSSAASGMKGASQVKYWRKSTELKSTNAAITSRTAVHLPTRRCQASTKASSISASIGILAGRPTQPIMASSEAAPKWSAGLRSASKITDIRYALGFQIRKGREVTSGITAINATAMRMRLTLFGLLSCQIQIRYSGTRKSPICLKLIENPSSRNAAYGRLEIRASEANRGKIARKSRCAMRVTCNVQRLNTQNPAAKRASAHTLRRKGR